MSNDDPDKRSSDFEGMFPYWQKVDAIMGGIKAMRECGATYLPQFPDEQTEQYEFRKKTSKLTNIFTDIIEDLSQRPFSEPVQISDEASEELKELMDDVDGKGNTLHVFAGDMFANAISHALDWILVDYTKDVPDNATRAAEKALGARPYWVHYRATEVLAAYSATINGREEFVHVRLWEPKLERDGFGEKYTERVRVFERYEQAPGSYGPPVYRIYEKLKNEKTGKVEWIITQEDTPISLDVIPLVPFYTGRRQGGWEIRPPMRDAADLQVEHYQQESALKYAKVMTAFPMLAGNGVEPQLDSNGNAKIVKVGPHRVLYAPPVEGGSGSWDWIEPDATSLTFLASDIKETGQELRELGRQPLTAQSGNLTRISSAVSARKGNTAIEAWVNNMKSALESAVALTERWLKMEPSGVTVTVNTDFDLSYGEDDQFDKVMELRKSGEISRDAVIHEAKRRDVLDRDYDPEDDLDKILEELEDETLNPPPPDPLEDEDEGDDTQPGNAPDDE